MKKEVFLIGKSKKEMFIVKKLEKAEELKEFLEEPSHPLIDFGYISKKGEYRITSTNVALRWGNFQEIVDRGAFILENITEIHKEDCKSIVFTEDVSFDGVSDSLEVEVEPTEKEPEANYSFDDVEIPSPTEEFAEELKVYVIVPVIFFFLAIVMGVAIILSIFYAGEIPNIYRVLIGSGASILLVLFIYLTKKTY